jgi:hypothetical protein
MSKKKSKGVLGKMGDAVATGAEAVIDAGAKAIESVGDLLPGAKRTVKRKASSKKATAKSKKAAPAKSAAKTTKKAKATVKAKAAKKAAKPKAKVKGK